MTPEQAGLDMRARIARGEKIAILFGRERFGLNNEEVSLADVIISAPVNPAYASLNIAQAVLLVSYEWFKHEATSLGHGDAGTRRHHRTRAANAGYAACHQGRALWFLWSS